jgi:hypothetical protein
MLWMDKIAGSFLAAPQSARGRSGAPVAIPAPLPDDVLETQ